MNIHPDLFDDDLSSAMGTETLLAHDLVPDGPTHLLYLLELVDSIFNHGAIDQPYSVLQREQDSKADFCWR
jgi:hypothetical protein